MTDREKLIDVFMHMGDHIRSLDEYGFVYDSTLAKAIEDVVAMLKQTDTNDVITQKWIPVTEQLPKEFISVLICVPSDHPLPVVKEAYWAKGCWYAKTWIYRESDVTHWMPMPEPPKEE